MIFKVTLSNKAHPEYGQATIPFPIPADQYDYTIELLEGLGIGSPTAQDCRVEKLDSPYPKTTYTYDPNGNLLSTTTALGLKTSHVYDSMGRVTSTADPMGHTVTFLYDAKGQLVGLTNKDGTDVAITYDANGNVLTVTDEEGYVVSYVYDKDGRMTQLTNARGFKTAYAYDKVGKAVIQYKHLYAYEKGEDGKPKIIPEQAEVVRQIYDSYLAGHSLEMIRKDLEDRRILTVSGGTKWSKAVVRGILQNEKYCGDVLQQKSFVNDCISRKHIRNVGQLPMYLTQDHHEGIVSRDTFNAVKAEFARRNSGHAPSQKQAPTGRSCYSGKYALTGRLVCGECGTLYRRCVWSKNGQKKAVWRCTNRLDYGTKYCHESPTLHEEPLKAAILSAINSAMSRRAALVEQIADSMRMELAPIPGEAMSLSDIDQRITELDREFRELFASSKEDGGYLKHADAFKRITEDMAALKEKKALILAQQEGNSAANRRIQDAVNILNAGSAEITEWDKDMIRQLVDTVKVLSADRIRVYLRGGMEIEQTIGGQ